MRHVVWAAQGKGTPSGLGWAIRLVVILLPVVILWGDSMLILAWGAAVALWWMFVVQADKTRKDEPLDHP